jgi:protein SCO1/2
VDRVAIALIALIGAALVAFGVYVATLSFPQAADVGAGAQLLAVPQPLPAFALVDHEGAGFDRSRLVGGWSLLFFGYTHCPDVCPFVLQELGRVAELARETAGPDALPQVVFVSVDPDRDPSDRLREYVHFFDPSFIGVTGSDAELARLARSVGAFYERRDGEDPASYLVDHSSTLFLVDPQARLFAVLDDPHDPREFVELLGRVMTVGDTP